MKKRRLALAAMALCCIFMMAVVSPALAENRVEVKVTSEPIPEKSPCDKAGGYTMEFDSRTEIFHGQQITIDLPPAVTLCRKIDMAIRVDELSGIPNALQDGRSCYQVVDPSSAVDAYGAQIEGALNFVITGAVGSQRVTIDVVEAGTSASKITVGGDSLDRFVLKFLDFPAIARTDVYLKHSITGLYTVTSDIEDNIRCINVSQYSGSEGRVRDNLDSRDDRFTFIPSDPQVAHPMPQGSFTCVNCEKTNAGYIEVVNEQEVKQCWFDYEDGTNYCPDTHWGNTRIMMQTATDLPTGAYSVTLEILDTPGVYWSSDAVTAVSDPTLAGLCSETSTSESFPAGTYYRASGAIGSPRSKTGYQCALSSYNKVVKVVTGGSSIVTPGDRVIWIDMPALLIDASEAVTGDTVKVKVSINKFPCGTIAWCEKEIGVIGCDTLPTASSLLYPYFTPMLDANWWSGLAVTNLGSTDGTAVLVIYESDGDIGTYEMSVEANSIVTIDGTSLAAAATQTGGSGTLGDARYYVTATTDFSADGLGFTASENGTSIGYLVRK